MRLIDADKLLVKLNKAYDEADAKYRESDFDSFWGGGCSMIQEVIKEVVEQPTACGANNVSEQGILISLPCTIGDDVYFVPSETNYRLNVLNHQSDGNKIYHQKVARITFSQNGWYLELDKDLECATDHILRDKMYKETWFLTRPEAEAKLKELEDKYNEQSIHKWSGNWNV